MKYSKYIPLISLLGDFLILNALFVVGYIIMQPKAEHFSDKHLLFYIYLNACWIVLFFVFGAHNVDRNTKKKSIFFTYVRIIVFYFFFFLMYFQAVPLQYYPRHHLKYLFALFFFSLILWKFVLYYAFYFYRKYGYNYRNVIILGYGNKAKELAKYFLTNPWHGYRFLGFIDKEVNLKRRIMGSWDDLKSFIEANDINQVYISWDTIPRSVLDDVSNLLADYPIKIRILPDLENFAYKSAELFKGKRVLIVGAGNSGCDIAVDAVHYAKSVDISVRRGYYFVPKYVFGKPADTLGGKLKPPPWLKQKMDSTILQWFTGDPVRFGFPKPDYKMYESHPVVNSLILHHLGHGDVTMRKDVERFDGDTVHFVDGSSGDYDLIVLATGYHLHYPFIGHDHLGWTGMAPDLYLNIFPSAHRNLFVLGMIEASGIGWQGRYEQAELIAAYLSATDEKRAAFERKADKIQREAQAKEICRTCPVKRPCLDYAVSIREQHGIWGGLNEVERRALLARESV